MLGLINNKNFNKSFKNLQKKNFPYVVIDNFFKKNIAIKLEKEFPKYENKILHEYKNFCEIKKSLNNWNIFPPLTYKTFTILNSNEVIKLLTKKLKRIAGKQILIGIDEDVVLPIYFTFLYTNFSSNFLLSSFFLYEYINTTSDIAVIMKSTKSI
mgnify:CR=1 FL=1